MEFSSHISQYDMCSPHKLLDQHTMGHTKEDCKHTMKGDYKIIWPEAKYYVYYILLPTELFPSLCRAQEKLEHLICYISGQAKYFT